MKYSFDFYARSRKKVRCSTFKKINKKKMNQIQLDWCKLFRERTDWKIYIFNFWTRLVLFLFLVRIQIVERVNCDLFFEKFVSTVVQKFFFFCIYSYLFTWGKFSAFCIDADFHYYYVLNSKGREKGGGRILFLKYHSLTWPFFLLFLYFVSLSNYIFTFVPSILLYMCGCKKCRKIISIRLKKL